MKRLLGLFLLSALAACGSAGTDANGDGIADGDPLSPDSVTQVAPSSPKGKVSGLVVDSQGKPLSGVAVAMSGTENASATTGADGMFAFDKVTGGSRVGLVFSRSGYTTAWATATVPGSTGNFPLNDGQVFVGPIGLLPAASTLTFHVVGYDGALVAAPAGTLVVTPGFVDFAQRTGIGSLSVSATGSAGVLDFAGVPAPAEAALLASQGITARYSLYLPPIVEGETLRYAGKTVSVSAAELLGNPATHTVVLDPPWAVEALSIEATNVENLVSCPSPGRANLVPRSGPLNIVFNQRISSNLVARVFPDSSDASKYLAVFADASVMGVANQLVIRPTADLEGFHDGQKYFLSLRVSSRDNPGQEPLDLVAPFFGGDPSTPQPILADEIVVQFVDNSGDGVLSPGEPIEIAFKHNLGNGLSSGFSVPLYFDHDLNGSGTVGDAAGELGSDRPYCVHDSETTPPVPGAAKSGYSRWLAASTTTSTLPPESGWIRLPVEGLSQPQSLRYRFAFSESHKCSGILHTVWGENLLANLDKQGITARAPTR